MGAVGSSSVKKSMVGKVYCHTVKLDPDRLYRFDGQDIGTFTMRGGACGKFTIENNGPGEQCTATICDDNGNIIFSEGHSFGDTITIHDNHDGSSSIIYTKFGKIAHQHPIPIRPKFNELIHLKGKRHFVIKGSGANLDYSGTGVVTVCGHVQRVKQSSSGGIRIRGSVNERVFQKGEGGRLFIDGNVKGSLIQRSQSLIQVEGSVFGNIEQDGNGEIRVWGKHHGLLTKKGNGRVLIENDEDEDPELEDVYKLSEGIGV